MTPLEIVVGPPHATGASEDPPLLVPALEVPLLLPLLAAAMVPAPAVPVAPALAVPLVPTPVALLLPLLVAALLEVELAFVVPPHPVSVVAIATVT